MNKINTFLKVIPQYTKGHLPQVTAFTVVFGALSIVALKHFGKLESIKAIPQYIKEHFSEVASFTVVAGAASTIALKYFGEIQAISTLSFLSIAFHYREKIYWLYKTFSGTQALALSVTTFILPFFETTFAIPAAAYLSWAFFKYEMQQIGTINKLENLNASLTQNEKALNERLRAYDDIASSIEKNLEDSIKNNESLSKLYTTIKQNTGQLGEVVEKDKSTIIRLSIILKHMCEMLVHVEKEGLVEDVIEASNLMKKIQEGQARLLSLEKQVKEITDKMSETNDRCKEATQRLEKAVTVLEEKNLQDKIKGDKQ